MLRALVFEEMLAELRFLTECNAEVDGSCDGFCVASHPEVPRRHEDHLCAVVAFRRGLGTKRLDVDRPFCPTLGTHLHLGVPVTIAGLPRLELVTAGGQIEREALSSDRLAELAVAGEHFDTGEVGLERE